MSDRIKSAYRASYIKSVDLPEGKLDEIFHELELVTADEEPLARDALKSLLDEFHTRSNAIVLAESKRTDLRDLSELLSRIQSANENDHWGEVALFIRELSRANPVLRQRLTAAFGKGGLGDPRVLEQLCAHEQVVAGLVEEIQRETRSGRRCDEAGNWFAHHVFDFWIRFTEQGTSRIHSGGRNDGGPFPDFLRKVGKLVDPDFNGYHHARRVHEEAQLSLEARKVEVEGRWPRRSRAD